MNSSNEVPIAFVLLWSISACVKWFFLKLLQKEILLDVEVIFSCQS